MRNYRLFLNKDKEKNSMVLLNKKSKKGKTNVAMFSDFFSSISDVMFCTNGMYSDFKNAVISTIDVCSTKEEIVIDIYESKESDDYKRELVQIGFKKYIEACYRKVKRESMNELLHVSLFAILGVLVVILGYSLKPLVAEWIMYCITNLGTVLIWQFVGYWAFEYAGQKRELDRLKQIETIKYEFKKWE